jgi:hypothetical protein
MAKVESAQREAIKNELINNHDAAPVGRILSDPEVTLDDMKGLSADEKAKLRAAITAQKATIGDTTYDALEALLKEAEKSLPTTPAATTAASSTKPAPTPVPGSESLRTAMKTKYDDKEYISKWYIVLGRMPGFEVGWVDDVKDALYQSHSNMLKYVSWLEEEYANPSKNLNTTSFDAGLYPFFFDKTKFNTPAEKQAYILRMIKDLKDAYSDPNKLMDSIIAYFTDWAKWAIWIWAVSILGLVLTAMWVKWFLNKKFGGWGVSIIDAWSSQGKWLIWKIVGAADNVSGVKWRLARATVKGIAWATAGWLVGFPGTGLVVGATRGAFQWPKNPSAAAPAAAPAWTPTATPTSWPASAVPFRELDMSKPIDKAVFDGIMRTLYLQEVAAGTRPALTHPATDPIPQNFIDEVKNGIDGAKTAEYQSRLARYQSLGNPPIWEAAKNGSIEKWKAEVERSIQWEQDPAKWNLKAKATVKANVGTNATALSARLAQAHAASQTETIRIGADEYKIDPRAKVPIQEIQNLQGQIAEQEAQKTELEAAKKKLEARLADEKKYAEARYTIDTIDAEILSKEAEVESTKRAKTAIYDSHKTISNHTWGPNTIDTTALNNDPNYTAAEKTHQKREWELKKLNEKKDAAKTLKSTLEGKYTNIDRWLAVDATGKLTDSKTMQKIEAPLWWAEVWVKAKITAANTEIIRLEGEINTRMNWLSSIISGIPNAWRKAGIDIRMPDGAVERVTKLSDLFAKLVKAAVKK